MAYRAIYAYAWDIAEAGTSDFVVHMRALGLDTVTIAGSYHAGKVHPSERQAGEGLFSRGRHGLFPLRSGALRPHQAGRQQPACDPRRAPRALRRAGDRDECLDGAPPQHADRPSPSGGDRRERLRRPLLLQPLPFGAGSARIRRRALQGRDRQLSRHRRLARDARLPPLPARVPPRVRADQAEPLARLASRPLLLRALHSRRREQGDRRERPEAKSRARYRGLSRRRCRFSGRYGRSVLARGHRERCRARGIPALPVRCRHVAGRGDPRRGAQRCRGCRHPLRRPADRGRLVRGHRPRRSCRSGRYHRGVLLRAERRAHPRRHLRREEADRRGKAARHPAPGLAGSSEQSRCRRRGDGAPRCRHHRHRLLQLRASAGAAISPGSRMPSPCSEVRTWSSRERLWRSRARPAE